MTPIQKLVNYLIYDENWIWLEYLISLLSTIEVELKLFKKLKIRERLNNGAIGSKLGNPFIENTIPKETFYCSSCLFKANSVIARFFYGRDDGYCYYLNRGDFSFVRPTTFLCTGFKECGINEDIEV